MAFISASNDSEISPRVWECVSPLSSVPHLDECASTTQLCPAMVRGHLFVLPDFRLPASQSKAAMATRLQPRLCMHKYTHTHTLHYQNRLMAKLTMPEYEWLLPGLSLNLPLAKWNYTESRFLHECLYALHIINLNYKSIPPIYYKGACLI